MIKALAFDFDGVLHNTFDLHLRYFNKLMSQGEFTADEYRDLHDGNIYRNTSLKDKLDLIDFSQYHDTIKDEYVVQNMLPHVVALLHDLSKKYKLFIVSSGGERHLIPFLEHNNVAQLFTKVLGKETHDLKVNKFNMIFNEFQIEPTEILFITDTLGDIREGHEVGVKTIAIDFGFHERERLERGNPYAIISSFDELYNYLG